jgi:hypothetical protein
VYGLQHAVWRQREPAEATGARPPPPRLPHLPHLPFEPQACPGPEAVATHLAAAEPPARHAWR